MIGLVLVFVVAEAAASDREPWTTESERFAGEYSLQRAIGTRGVQGRILLDEYEPEGGHAQFVRNTAIEWGVPSDRLDVEVLGELARDTIPRKYAVISQAHSGAAHLDESEMRVIEASGAIVVAGAGNPGEGRAGKGGRTVHYLVPEHPHWRGTQGRAWWNRALKLMRDGHLIIARASKRTGNEWEKDTSVHCGQTKTWCYTVRAHDKGLGEGSTSKAATLLASLILMLREVETNPVEALNECAVDIGAPGIDPVFGRGLVSVDCERVREALKERTKSQLDGSDQT